MRILTVTVVLLGGLLTAARAATLTGIVIHGASSTGAATGPVWNTWGGFEASAVPNIYADAGAGILNPGNGPSNALNFALNLGTNVIGYCIQPSTLAPFWTLDLFFEGSVTPGISALVASGVSTPAANSAQTYRLDGQALVPGAGSLTTVVGGFKITLLQFTMTGLPSKGFDAVQNFDNTPGGGDDTQGPFLLQVEAVPEPAVSFLTALGLAAAFTARRRLERR